MGAPDYGRYYWCVVTDTSNVYLHADRLEITPTGALVAFSDNPNREPVANIAWASGKWDHFYAASVMDGTPVAVEHWDHRALARKGEEAAGDEQDSIFVPPVPK